MGKAVSEPPQKTFNRFYVSTLTKSFSFRYGKSSWKASQNSFNQSMKEECFVLHSQKCNRSASPLLSSLSMLCNIKFAQSTASRQGFLRHAMVMASLHRNQRIPGRKSIIVSFPLILFREIYILRTKLWVPSWCTSKLPNCIFNILTGQSFILPRFPSDNILSFEVLMWNREPLQVYHAMLIIVTSHKQKTMSMTLSSTISM